MTLREPTTTPSPRPRTLQDDLLDDLRQAAPMPIGRLNVDHSSSVPAERSDPTDPATPTVDVRVTPLRWSAPSLRVRGTRTGLALTAGPVRVSITGFGR